MEFPLIRTGVETPNSEPELNGVSEGASEGLLLQNNATQPWIVHKYGGTAVGKFPRAISQNVRQQIRSRRVGIVCSARSTNVKTQGTTTRLV